MAHAAGFASAESENVYFYEQEKCLAVVGNCGTGHTCEPLPNIKKNERVIQKKIKTEFKHHITK